MKRHAATLLAAVLLAGAGSVPAMAADSSGDAGLPGAFLSYGAGARAMGMGRAFTGLADDATTLYWNPGGLATLKQNQVILQTNTLIDGNSYHYLGYDHIFPYIGTLGVGFVYLNQGAAEGRDTYNELTDSFANQQMAFLFGFGSDITPTLSAGTNLKIITQSLMNAAGTGFGADLGILYHPWPIFNLGLQLQNLLSPAITLREEAERYPMNLTLGLGLRLLDDHIRADVDLSKNMEQASLKPRAGIEILPIRDLFVRAGIDDTEIALGLGYRYLGFQLDYAVGLQAVETMHKVSLSYYFGGFVLNVYAEPETFSPVGINKVTVIKIQSQTKFQVRVWNLDIRNEANSLVKKYSGEGSPPDHIVWDGLLDTTNPMPDGRYHVVLTIEDASGETRTVDTYVNLQSILPLGVSPVEMLD